MTATRESRDCTGANSATWRERAERAEACADAYRAALERLESMRLMGEAIGGALHELNNLLTAVLGLSAQARLGLPPNSPVAADLEELDDLVADAAHRLRAVMAIGRDAPPDPQTQDLGALVRGTASLLRWCTEGRAHLTFELAETPCWAVVDTRRFQQALANLVANAADAAGEDARITISTGPGPKIGQVCVGVADNGPGIPEALRQQVLEPFFTTKAVAGGSGLGLSQVRRFAADAGGELALGVSAQGGALVTVVLPSAAPPLEVTPA